jgi:signal transduction histidine kinase
MSVIHEPVVVTGSVAAAPKRALVVGDDPELGQFIASALGSECEVVCVASGTEKEAQACEDVHPALVVVDGDRFARIAREHLEPERLVESLRAACEQAERKGQAKSDLLNMVAHELRTPLSVIQLQVQMLARPGTEALSPSQATALARTQRATARLLQLVDSLLEYTRAQSGQITIRTESFDVALLVDEIVDEARTAAERKGLEVRVDVRPGLPALRSDRRLVGVVLTNLVGNAIKFTERGSVGVSIAEEGGTHVVSVVDTGPGIPEQHQSRIFEPFYQPERGGQPSGFGLGLALARQLVATLSGSIQLESREGVGSTFHVRFPPLDAGRVQG